MDGIGQRVTSLFVYGSLRPGESNHHVLAHVRGAWCEGSVRGTVSPLGWGAALGYPGLTLDPEGDEVRGWLLTSPTLAEELEALDRFEGPEYRRVSTLVARDGGGSVEAFVYVVRAADEDDGGPTVEG